MPRVYVVNASAGRGGAYMAYHIGRLLHQEFGYIPMDVKGRKTGKPVFTYDTPMQPVSLEAMQKGIGREDILICNPSYSDHMFGLRLPGRKIMYVQDFRTFSYLDCHFDLYVSVSTTVRDYLRATYGIESPVIPPFISTHSMPSVTMPWEERPENQFMLYCKTRNPAHYYALEQLSKYVPATFEHSLILSDEMTHEEFLKQVASTRYLINLSIAEGFGLVPLEAFALGTLVLGLDGAGGRDYMRYGQNCYTVPFRSFKDWLKELPALLQLPPPSAVLEAAKETSHAYGYEPFRARWMEILKGFLHGAT